MLCPAKEQIDTSMLTQNPNQSNRLALTSYDKPRLLQHLLDHRATVCMPGIK